MQFRIADTFTDSLAKLQSDEQKAIKTTAFDLQIDPANPRPRFHKARTGGTTIIGEEATSERFLDTEIGGEAAMQEGDTSLPFCGPCWCRSRLTEMEHAGVS